MSAVDNKAFAVPLIGTDPVSKGQFRIQSGFMVWNDDDDNNISRAKCEILITAIADNPLYKVAKASPLRLQGLISTVMFGAEKRFVKFLSIHDYSIIEDNFIAEIELSVVFEIFEDNLIYLENVVEYKDQNLL
jgi:hypothetical protein